MKPTDPIRDPELAVAAQSAVDAIDALVTWMAVSGLAEEGGGLPLYEKTKPLAEARAELAAALLEDPPVRRYSLEEISERLLGGGMVEQFAACRAEGSGTYSPDRKFSELLPAVQAMWRSVARRELTQAADTLSALATAFDGATPTQPDHNCFDCGHPVSQHSGQREATGCEACDCKRWFDVWPADQQTKGKP